jgi:hypothetical protein
MTYPGSAAYGPPGASGTGGPGGLAVAPTPPGRLGEAPPADVLRRYLEALGGWVRERKDELDRLDEASLRATDPDAYTGDVELSMALWQSVSDRHDALVRAWDSGRADARAREGMSQLIWGRMDAAGAGGLGVTLVEAARLSDALAAQLRARLSFDPRASEAAVRVTSLRAALERLRELVKVEPSWGPQVELLGTRIDDLGTRAARGGDVSGPLSQLEVDAARAERDLIVRTASQKHRVRAQERAAADLVGDRVRAESEVEALQHREDAARLLAGRCRRAVARPPKFAVPDVSALGPVPHDRDGLDAFLARLADVARAMDTVERAYAAPLAQVEELRGLLDGYRVMAARAAGGADPATQAALEAALESARAAVRAVPCDVAAARRAVTGYQGLVRSATPVTAPSTRSAGGTS